MTTGRDGMVSLISVALRDFVRAPTTFFKDTAEASWIVARRCTLPLALSVFVLGFGALGIEAGIVLDAVGSPDRTGGVYVTTAVRENEMSRSVPAVADQSRGRCEAGCGRRSGLRAPGA